ncbi:MAG: FAD-dependent oxidoreductase [Gemmataceae bacterium]|nr:FAD-dependent oxidoreductase [Gemmataceae bacterium]
MNHFDLLILGSGSTAFAAALTAQELGKTAVMTEERVVGGTCVNRGCLPSKNLIEAAKLLHDARNPRYPGLTPGPADVDFAALVAQKDEVVHGYRNEEVREPCRRACLHREGPRRVRGPTHGRGRREAADRRDGADRHRLPLGPPGHRGAGPGAASDKRPADRRRVDGVAGTPRSLLVVGGGYIALELGLMFARFGSDVTVLERSEQLLAHGYEPEVGRAVGQVFADEGVRVVTRVSVRSVRKEGNEVVATAPVGGTQREYRAEKLLVATGRRPNTDHIAIDRAGVAVSDRGEVEVDEYLRTSVPHVFAAGDVIGGRTGSQMATPVGSQDGGIAARNALSGGELRAVDHRVIPRVIFTDPQVAVVGITEEQAVAAGHPCWCNTVPMSLVPRAGAIRDTRGLVKMVADAETNEVLGVSMVGPSAGEVIHEAAMGMRFRAGLHDFIDLLHVFPTMAEALKIVATSRFKDPAKLSCCAE